MPPTPPPTCDAPGPNGARCYLLAGHPGTAHRGIASWQTEAPADDAPTERLPPIGSTVRRRPPVPNVRELQGPELLRALADELDRDGYTTDDL
jgi:hypothetical protein